MTLSILGDIVDLNGTILWMAALHINLALRLKLRLLFSMFLLVN